MTAYGIRFESAVVRVANDARVEGLGIDTQDTNNQGLEQQPQRLDVPRDPFGPRVQRREGKRRIHEVARKRASGKSWAQALRCLKHRIARPVFRLLQAGQLEWARAT